MAVRVLRLIEYVYESAELAADDMARWTLQHENKAPGRKARMRSTTLPFETIEWEDGDNNG